jgi:hypothetical protein
VDHVVPLGRAFRNPEANDVGLTGGYSTLYLFGCQAVAPAIVLERLLARLGLAASRVELRRRAEATIRSTAVEEFFRVGLVARKVCALIDDGIVPERVLSSVLRALSVSSMRRRNSPPNLRA